MPSSPLLVQPPSTLLDLDTFCQKGFDPAIDIDSIMQKGFDTEAIEAVDSVVESLIAGNECPPWIESALNPSAESWRRADALWFEMTETFDSAAADDAYFGLDKEDMRRVATNFSQNDVLSDTLKYELTEDFGPCEKIWDDSEFGFSEDQLEVLWKRFGTHMSDIEKNGESTDTTALGFGTPAEKTLDVRDRSHRLPCTQALETIEESVAHIEPEKLSTIIGDGTLEQFIGSEVPQLPRPGIRAFLLSTKKFDGEDWYLFKVVDSGSNRFYMKSYGDFEELHAELTNISKEYPQAIALPQLGGRDWLGIRRFFGGQDFESSRSEALKQYLKELMMRPLPPCQEQVIRLFFGPCARGRIMPPKGPLFRAGKSYAF
jgi:hypothetical protein